ncbi:hypothetical protein VNO77_10092 [Canavalia gladiata]|uniref:Uncharacterized protein n=1 Tax=Canavalia gladiata TaxID=3824 RepID=A0AAN9MAK5_CANGL
MDKPTNMACEQGFKLVSGDQLIPFSPTYGITVTNNLCLSLPHTHAPSRCILPHYYPYFSLSISHLNSDFTTLGLC